MAQTQTKPSTSKDKFIGFVVLTIIVIIVYAMCGGDSKKEETKKNAATIRKEKIEKGFSAWDGSHTKLVELTKAQMNDPKSFDHLQTN